MTGTVMLFNPPHNGKRSMAKKRRKHLTPKQARYFGTPAQRRAARKSAGRKSRRKGRVRATVTEKIVYRKNPRHSMSKRRGKKRHYRRARSVKHRRYRRNPVSGGLFEETFGVALVGAGGAVAVDWLGTVLPLSTLIPASITQSLGQYAQPILNIGLSLLVGVAVDAVGGAKAGGEAAAGGIIVQLYNLAQQMLPSLTGNAQGQFGQNGFNGQGQFNRGQFQNQGQLNRYLGARNFLTSPATRNFRALSGRSMLNPPSVGPQLSRYLGATSPFAAAQSRSFGRGRGLGYVGPAKTLGRYMQPGS